MTELVLDPATYLRWWYLPGAALIALLSAWAFRVYRRERRRHSKQAVADAEAEATAGCHVA